MCGFAGILDTSGRPVERGLLARFNQLMAHRGPDGEGIEIDGPVGLAHRRLSILDLSEAAHQPMWDEERRACLAFNGEIYNFREIRRDLERAGWTFRSSGDTEVLLKACLEWGVPGAVERVNGMFGLAFWDPKERRLWLSRDRMGIKPLYFTRHQEKVVFGSEIKPLLEVRPAEPDTVTLLDVLAGEAPNWGPHTLYEGILSVEPGEWLCFSPDGEMRRGRYFRLLDQLDPDAYREAERTPAPDMVRKLRDVLEQSVKLHMISDAPVAVLASGGLDSNLIARMAGAEHRGLELYHAEVEGPYSERWAAEALGHYLEMPLHVARLERDRYVRDLAEVAYYNECPSGYHPNDVPFHVVSRAAAERGVKVLLTGEGADELFHGYESMVLRMGRRTITGIGERARRVLGKLPGGRQLLALLPRADEMPANLLRRGYEHALKEEAREACAFLPDPEDREILADSVVACAAHLQSLLHRNDRMGMMEHLESRIPYLENELVRFAINLPRKFKVPRHPLAPGLRHPMRQNKWLLRQVGTQLLPQELHSRKKMGFPVAPWDHLQMDPEFFADGFLLNALHIPYGTWTRTWEGAGEEFQWTAFATEIWGRIYFQGTGVDEMAERLLPLATPIRAMAA